jgi:outer membrane protein TolC
MILMTESEIEQKNILLNTLMNIDKQTKYEIDTNAVKTDQLQTIDTASLISNRSDIRMFNSSIESMKLNTKLMSFEAKPDFNLRFEHMSPLGKGMPNMFTAMAMVSLPIAPWSSKMYRSQVKGMNHEIQAMEMAKEGILSEAEGMVKSMAVEIRKMEQQLKNYQGKIIPALKKNYSTEMLAYEENKGQLPSVIDAWEALNMAQMEYLNKLEQWYLMIVTYEKELEK